MALEWPREVVLTQVHTEVEHILNHPRMLRRLTDEPEMVVPIKFEDG